MARATKQKQKEVYTGATRHQIPAFSKLVNEIKAFTLQIEVSNSRE